MGNSSHLLVEGNYIGTDVSGTLNLGNQSNGVSLASSSNTIGGTIGGAGNTIDFNGAGKSGSGVQLVGKPDRQRDPLQLDLPERGPGNQPGQRPHPQPRARHSRPEQLSKLSDSVVGPERRHDDDRPGSLNSLPSTKFLIQFFASPSTSLSGFGQGKLLIGSDT